MILINLWTLNIFIIHLWWNNTILCWKYLLLLTLSINLSKRSSVLFQAFYHRTVTPREHCISNLMTIIPSCSSGLTGIIWFSLFSKEAHFLIWCWFVQETPSAPTGVPAIFFRIWGSQSLGGAETEEEARVWHRRAGVGRGARQQEQRWHPTATETSADGDSRHPAEDSRRTACQRRCARTAGSVRETRQRPSRGVRGESHSTGAGGSRT